MIEQATITQEQQTLLAAIETLPGVPSRARHRIAAVLSDRGETPECVPHLRNLLEKLSVDELVSALSTGVGWERLCQPGPPGVDQEPVQQKVLAILHAHGGSASVEELGRRVPHGELVGAREQLESQGWLRVVRASECNGNRWTVPLGAASAAAGAWSVRGTDPDSLPVLDQRDGGLDYRADYRSVMRALEQAPRRDRGAVQLLLDILPAALVSGDAWTVGQLARRHLGGTGPEQTRLSVGVARLMWTAGLPELARVTLRMAVRERGPGISEAITTVLVDTPGAGLHRLESMLELGRRAVHDEGDATLAALAVIDASVEAAWGEHRSISRDLGQVAYELALHSGQDHLVGRCCLVEGLLHLLRGDQAAAIRSLDAALGLVEPHGVAIAVTSVVDSFAPAFLVGPSTASQARQMVAGFLSRRLGELSCRCHVARQVPAAEGPELFDEAIAYGPGGLLGRLRDLHRGFVRSQASHGRTQDRAPQAWNESHEAGPDHGLHEPVSLEASRAINGTEVLTPRELEVAHLVSLGLTNEQVARRLGISRWTVVNHLRNVMRKLDCVTRVEVTRHILEHHRQPLIAMA